MSAGTNDECVSRVLSGFCDRPLGGDACLPASQSLASELHRFSFLAEDKTKLISAPRHTQRAEASPIIIIPGGN